MKKYIFLFISLLVISSCEKNVEFNDPAFQGLIDGVLWKASTKSANKKSNGSIEVSGITSTGNITLLFDSANIGKRVLGTLNGSNMATYTLSSNGSTSVFTSQATTGPAYSILLSTGGAGYTQAQLVETSTTGTGTGLKVDITVDAAGIVTSVKINSPGNNYKAGDIVTILGGTSPARFTVQSVTKSNGEISITEFEGGKISGNFKFVIYDSQNNKTVYCRDGVFYKVPVN